jgi:hypothetical protein
VSQSGKPWTLFKIVADGQVYTTFEGKWREKLNLSSLIEYEEVSREKNGKQYMDRRIVEPKKRGGGFPSGLVMDKLSLIETKVDMVLEWIREQDRK